ncbi:hypothetical protein ANO14919_129700 [Xylariales sp. No.14919]|nr:hypothetical protein ANO14919_129700 [Xylariales sp. No.14919]
MERTRITPSRKRRYSGEQNKRTLDRGGDDGDDDDNNSYATLGEGNTARRKSTPIGSNDENTTVPRPCEPSQPTHRIEMGGRDEEYFRSLYSTEPDFYHLGLKYPEFGAMLRDGAHLDFTDPAAVMQLTKTLLREDFGLHIQLPPDRLCPPVPNRHNYILWLKDLLDSTSSSYSQGYEPERRVTGLDIGTGASSIYPLLGCVQRPTWHFIATDVDADSLASARANVRRNRLESRIRIVDRTASDPLIPLDDLDIETIDFAMVNPPFYASDAELLDLAAQKAQPPHSACTGAPIEMVCEGGEVRFVDRMISESLVLRDRVQWYTAMLGKQSSIDVLVDTLKKHGVNNFAITTFIQGSRTRRWALGWSFLTRRPSLGASRGCGSLATKRMLPPITAITISGPATEIHTNPIPSLQKALCDAAETLDLRSWVWDEQRLYGVGFADGNVWSRAYRRRKAEEVVVKHEMAAPPRDVAACAFGFSVSIQPDHPDQPRGSPTVILRWLQGDDESLFESFSGVIRRCLRAGVTHPV